MAIGTITNLEGSVKVEKPNGDIIELSEGDTVDSNDTIITDENSGTTIEFVDKSTLVVTESGKITLDEMVYDPSTQEGNFAIDLVSGIFVYVSGDIAKFDPNSMILNTPVGTIGIRGTQLGVKIFEGETTFTLMAEADGTVGELVITDLFGNVVVLNQEGQTIKATAENGLGEITTLSFEEIGEIFDLPLEYLARSGSYNGNPYDNLSESNQDDGSDLIDFNTEAGGEQVGFGEITGRLAEPSLNPSPLVGGSTLVQTDLPIPTFPTPSTQINQPIRSSRSAALRDNFVEPVNEVSRTVENTVAVSSQEISKTVATSFVDDTTKTNNLENNITNVTVTRNYTDTTTTETLETTTTTPVYTITYSDGSVEILQGDPVITTETLSDTTTQTREETIFTGTEEPVIETAYDTQTETVVGDEVLAASNDVVSTETTADTENNRDRIDTTTTTTNVYETTTTVTTTTTPVYTITYSDGTVEMEYGTPTETFETSIDPREEVLVNTETTYEEPEITVEYQTEVTETRGEETLLSTIYEDDVSRENDLENNREVITTDRQYTDTYSTLVTTTTSITPVYLITYLDGTTEIEYGETKINEQETTETRTDTRTEQTVQYESAQVTTNYETQITTSIISTNTNTSYIDDTKKENDLENNITNVEVTRNYTDTMIETVSEKTITTPVYTISYSDGTTEIEYGEPTIEENIYDKEPEETTRSEIIYTGTEEPIIITTYNTVTETNTLDPVLVDSEVSSEFDTEKDGRNKQDITTETITTVETYNTETVTTTTETPVYTIVYFDGTTETEFGESNSTSSSEFETTTETTYSTGSVTYEDWTVGTGANNGFGNGDQDAPGNSEDNNNAENSTTSVSDFVIVEEDESIDFSNILGPEPDPVIEETKSNKGNGKGKVEENVGENVGEILIFSGENYTTTVSDDLTSLIMLQNH